MRIERDEFIMESSFPDVPENNTWFFDLSFPHVINKGKENERTEWKCEDWSCTTIGCANFIAERMTANQQEQKEIVKKLLTEFKELGLRTEKHDWSKYDSPRERLARERRERKKQLE